MGMNYLDRRMEQLRTQAYIDNQVNGQGVQQMCFDAAMIALHEEFGFGAERIKRFRTAMLSHMDEMADLILQDDDPDAIYAKEVIDRKLREILGPDVIPWDERYLPQINPARNRAQRRAQKKGRR